jgi:hypothetical protein
MNERDEIAAELINASNTIFNVIIRRLHEHHLIDKDVIREILTALAGEPRPMGYDRLQFQKLAEMLSNRDDIPGPHWTPVVVQGGGSGERELKDSPAALSSCRTRTSRQAASTFPD